MAEARSFDSYRHLNKHVRGDEKREHVLCWLSTFHYSTRNVLARMLGVDPAGQYAFFNRLIRADLIRTFKVPTLLEDLVMLTGNGLEHARALTERALVYGLDPTRIGSARVIHALSVQMACLSFTSDFRSITSERHLDFAERLKLPDAIVKLPDQTFAIEVELTHKNSARIFRAFYDSIQNIKGGHYQHVRYIFPNDVLRGVYERHFQTPAWPLYERDKRSHVLRPILNNGVPQTLRSNDPRIQQLFSFDTNKDLYR
jgi:hypothetical protein